ncbi:MAG: hypothetical protein JNK04_10025 [Myxococcales bacterium]|nr:hypothetical protein [Myxococcales bacterium]
MSAAHPHLVWQWEGGGDATLTSLVEDAAVLRSTKPFAPGSRPLATLANGAAIRLKTHRSRREDGDDGKSFTIDGRVLDLTRELRAFFGAALAPPAD